MRLRKPAPGVKRLWIGIAAAAIFLYGCAEEQGSEPAGEGVQSLDVSVEAFDFYFEPQTIPVELGQEINLTFTNNGDNNHSFSAPDLDVEIEASSGNTVEGTFSVPNDPGSLEFFCKYHPDDMQGTITIGGAEEPIQDNDDETDDDDVDVDVDVEEDDQQ